MNISSQAQAAINQLLDQLHELLTAFDKTLNDENQAIKAHNADAITSATNAKIALLQSIEMSSRQLDTVMAQLGYADASKQIGMDKASLAFELGEVWTRFTEKLADCHHKNTVNGRAIELNRASTDRMINLIRGNDKPVYGRAGRMQNQCDITTLAEA
jgi:flagellar biosynthesis/type III secretory pathway chaperone